MEDCLKDGKMLLIELDQKNPCLWNVKMDKYTAVVDAIKEDMKRVGLQLPQGKWRKIWINSRSPEMKNKNIAEIQKSDARVEHTYIPTKWWFDALWAIAKAMIL